ncbi:hypothetical protein Poli38472_008925 [Pythium oligandrum]|uniref:Importin N-terminal domain-containing protein n=1 Tax=Pythium oligandrum TaxID=41045 RepID=A0A8K1C546_PYTOL|nr:hypothetical protein Poli38472_008925 [Pythium oligandrum]|eukprot:TMW56277.1 hypothetical protein Poli38472_008925 [Pythium oligandrum]
MTMADVQMLLALLAQSMGAPEPTRAEAEKQLADLQQQPLTAAFLATLVEQSLVIPDAQGQPREPSGQMDENVRLMACLWLKHFVKRQWKALRHWSDEEKRQFRQVLLFAALYEPNATIALHLTLILATLARGDFPAQWKIEELFSPVLQMLQSEQATKELTLVRHRRSIDVTYRVVKELSTRRLMMHRKQFAALSVEIIPLVLQHWCSTANALDLSLVTSAAAPEHLGMLLTTTKLLSTIFMNAFRDLAMLQNGEIVQAALQQLYEKLERVVQVRQTLIVSHPGGEQAESVVAVLDKVAFRMASLIVGIQKAYPIEFRAYLSPFMNLFWNVLVQPMQSSATDHRVPKRLQIESLQFFANVLSCRLYKRESLSSELTGDSSSVVTKVITATGDVSLTDSMVLEAQSAVDSFFSASMGEESRLEMLLRLVVLHYMKLQPSDLDEWSNDSEAFVILSENLTAQESIRACAENLFLTVLQNFPQQTIPVLTQLTAAASSWLAEITQRSDGPSPDVQQRVLESDAVLLAIGLGCYDLHDCFEFEPWFLSNLVPLLVNQSASIGSINDVPVLKYRVVWLVSCWLAQLTANIRAPLYDALLNASAFFKPEADAALKLRIVQSLESMVNDWGFDRSVFLPFLPRAVECLYAFFPQTDESESKMKVLGCLDAIVQACGGDIISFSELISSPLPAMWTSGGEAENLVLGKILQLLAKLLSNAKECDASVAAQHAVALETLKEMSLQVVRFATDVSNPDEVFLMESGLELWVETLEISTVYTENLHVLFQNAIRLMERDYEHIKLVMTLLERYVRLGTEQFWQSYHASVENLLQNVVGNVKAEASIQIARTVELIVAAYSSAQLVGCRELVTQLVAACAAYQRKESGREPENVIVAYLVVIAQLLRRHLELVVVQIFGNDLATFVAVLDLLVNKFFTVGSVSMSLARRKVWAVGMCAALDVIEQPVLEKLGQIMECCADVLDEEVEAAQEANKPSSDDDESESGGAYRAYKSHRTKQSSEMSDTVVSATNIDLKAMVQTKLSAIATKLGPDLFGQLLQTIDSSVLTKFQ